MSAPLSSSLAPLTVPASWLYRGVIAARNRHYDRGNGVRRLPVPVISVGNITTGGTGKTPMVARIARLLLEHGHEPAIAMRGYGATTERPSDEQLEYRDLLPEVPVIADPDRYGAVSAFLREHPQIDVVLLDDGFQHRQLHRDLDLVLVDASRTTLSDRLLPAGHLREPPASLRRADAVIITRAERLNANLAAAIETHHGRLPLAWSRCEWAALRCVSASGEQRVDPAWLKGRRIMAMLGVGNPQAITRQLEMAGAEIAAYVQARDHEPYNAAKLAAARRACGGCDAMVVTSKDWVKLRELLDLPDWPAPVVVPELVIDLFEGREAFEAMILKVAGGDPRRVAAAQHGDVQQRGTGIRNRNSSCS